MAVEFDTEVLKSLYDQQRYTIDMLPYTVEFDSLVSGYNHLKNASHSPREIYVALMNLRKRSKLSPKGRRSQNATAKHRP